MSDVLDEIISKLKQKAKSGVNILEEVENSDFTIICRFSDNIDECLSCRCSGCKWKEEKKWVRLEDVKAILEQIKQNYVLISKKELKKKLAEIKFYGTKINGQLSDKPEYSPRYLADFIEKELLKEC